jgi:hypothetical protein
MLVVFGSHQVWHTGTSEHPQRGQQAIPPCWQPRSQQPAPALHVLQALQPTSPQQAPSPATSGRPPKSRATPIIPTRYFIMEIVSYVA